MAGIDRDPLGTLSHLGKPMPLERVEVRVYHALSQPSFWRILGDSTLRRHPPELLANYRYNSRAAVVGWRVPRRVGFLDRARHLSPRN